MLNIHCLGICCMVTEEKGMFYNNIYFSWKEEGLELVGKLGGRK